MYIVTKHGFVHLYDIETGTRIYSNRISTETVFVTTEYQTSGGIMGINRKGQVGGERNNWERFEIFARVSNSTEFYLENNFSFISFSAY